MAAIADGAQCARLAQVAFATYPDWVSMIRSRPPLSDDGNTLIFRVASGKSFQDAALIEDILPPIERDPRPKYRAWEGSRWPTMRH